MKRILSVLVMTLMMLSITQSADAWGRWRRWGYHPVIVAPRPYYAPAPIVRERWIPPHWRRTRYGDRWVGGHWGY